jgi:hypothetical protein
VGKVSIEVSKMKQFLRGILALATICMAGLVFLLFILYEMNVISPAHMPSEAEEFDQMSYSEIDRLYTSLKCVSILYINDLPESLLKQRDDCVKVRKVWLEKRYKRN